MKRSKVEWSNATDVVEGPCVVCGKDVRYVIPDDRPDPAILHHSTCDPIQIIRETLKTIHPAPLTAAYILNKPKPASSTPV